MQLSILSMRLFAPVAAVAADAMVEIAICLTDAQQTGNSTTCRKALDREERKPQATLDWQGRSAVANLFFERVLAGT